MNHLSRNFLKNETNNMNTTNVAIWFLQNSNNLRRKPETFLYEGYRLLSFSHFMLLIFCRKVKSI